MGCFTKEEIHEMYKNMFNTKMSIIHPTIIHGGYISAYTKIPCECTVCNYTWQTTPDILLRSNKPSGCPKCAKIFEILPMKSKKNY